MHHTPPSVCSSALQAIGNTPVVRLQKVVPPNSAEVLVKLEYFNPTGSYKDRMALSMIEEAEARGTLRPGMTVVEYTGGSQGLYLQGRLIRCVCSRKTANHACLRCRANYRAKPGRPDHAGLSSTHDRGGTQTRTIGGYLLDKSIIQC